MHEIKPTLNENLPSVCSSSLFSPHVRIGFYLPTTCKGLFPTKDMQIFPLSFAPIFMIDAQSAESNGKSFPDAYDFYFSSYGKFYLRLCHKEGHADPPPLQK